jgi:hypothetical protein
MQHANLFFWRSFSRTCQVLFTLLLIAWASTQALAQYGSFALSQGILKSTEPGVLSFGYITNPPCAASQLSLLVNGNVAIADLSTTNPQTCNGNLTFGFDPNLIQVGDQITIKANCTSAITTPVTVVGNAFVLTSQIYSNSLNIYAAGRNGTCDPNQIILRINGVDQPAGTLTPFATNFGLFLASVPFGLFKPGDQVTLYEPCTGHESIVPMTVREIPAYVEIAGDASNGIGPAETGSAYDRMNTPVQLYTCNTLQVAGHAGFTIGFNASENEQQIGVFRLNNAPISADQAYFYYNRPNADLAPEFTAAYSRSRYYFNGGLNQLFFGPTTFSYTHNGVTACNDISLTLGPIALTQISTGGGTTTYGYYTTGRYQDKQFSSTSNPNAVFELGYDGTNYTIKVDGSTIATVPRSVAFSTSLGTMTPGSVALPYGSGAVYSPTGQTGEGYIEVKYDGYLIQRQKIKVDAVSAPTPPSGGSINATVGDGPQTVTFSGCSGTLNWTGSDGTSGTGSITLPTTTAGTITYSATCTLQGCTGPASTLTYTVSPRPFSPPVANEDKGTTPVNTPITLCVLTNDQTASGAAATTSNVTMPAVTQPSVGTVTVDANGCLVYNPPFNFTGIVPNFPYTICDKADPTQCATTTVSITVTQGNPPQANPDVTTTPLNTPVTNPILGNDKGPDGTPATLANVTLPEVIGNPTHGTVVVNPDGTTTYTPNSGYVGTDELTYTICSLTATESCVTTTETITIQSGPPAPQPHTSTVIFNKPLTICVLGNDTDKNGAQATLNNVTMPVIVVNPEHGSAVVDAQGCVIYTPTPGYTGPDVFTYQICDQDDPSKCATTTESIIITSIPPVANDDRTTTPFNTPITVCVLANDTDKNGLQATLSNVTMPVITGQPGSGTVTVDANGCFVFTPEPGFTGEISFPYQICDRDDPTKCDDATVTITVVSGPPAPQPDITETPFNTPKTYCVLGNDTDKNGTQATLDNVTMPVIVSQPANGSALVDANGCIVYTPNPGFTGPDVLTYQICDQEDPSKCATTTETITVRSAPPIANPDVTTTPINTPKTICVLGNDTDKNGKVADLTNVSLPTLASNPAHGSVTLDPATGCMVYTPGKDYTGIDTYTYTICDKADPSKCSTTTVTITINACDLQVVEPKYNCSTHEVCLQYNCGDGSPIKWRSVGLTDWTYSLCVVAGDDLVHDPKVLLFEVMQGSKTVYYNFDMGKACPGNGPGTGPLAIYPPQYDCNTGAIRFFTTGGNATMVEFMVPGLMDWTTQFNQVITPALKGTILTIYARQSGVTASGSFDLAAACQPASPTTPGSSTQTGGSTPATGTTTLALIPPGYNCATGDFQFRTSGGDGSLIEFQANGITDWTRNANQQLDKDARTAADAPPFTLKARQSGQVVTYTWSRQDYCDKGLMPFIPPTTEAPPVNPIFTNPGSTTPTPAPTPTPTPTPSTGPLAATVVSYNCTTGAITLGSLGGNGSTAEFMAIGITGWSSSPNQYLDKDARTAADTPPFQIRVRQNGIEGTPYTWSRQTYCSAGTTKAPDPVQDAPTSPILLPAPSPVTPTPEPAPVVEEPVNPTPAQPVQPSNPTPPTTTPITGPLTLVTPDYNCSTGAITFKTSGGNGTGIEFMAIGITGWSSNPNQFLDSEARTAGDTPPFTLMARQNGVTVTLTWSRQQACGQARVGIHETPLTVTVLGNPIKTSQVEIQVSGAEGQPLHILLIDLTGRVISTDKIDSAQALEKQTIQVGADPGVRVLRVSTPYQTQVIKLIKE